MYYELKAIFVLWLLSPATQGAEVLYMMYIHPRLLKHENVRLYPVYCYSNMACTYSGVVRDNCG